MLRVLHRQRGDETIRQRPMCLADKRMPRLRCGVCSLEAVSDQVISLGGDEAARE